MPVGARSDIKFPGDKKALHSAFKNLGSIPDIRTEDETKNSSITYDKRKITPPSQPPELAQSTLSADRIRKESSSLRSGTEKSLSDTAAVIWDLHQGEQMSASTKENTMTASDVKINELTRTSSFKASPLRNM